MVVILALVTMALLPSWQIIYNESECLSGEQEAIKDFNDGKVGRFIERNKIEFGPESIPCIIDETNTSQSCLLFPHLTVHAEKCYWQTINRITSCAGERNQ